MRKLKQRNGLRADVYGYQECWRIRTCGLTTSRRDVQMFTWQWQCESRHGMHVLMRSPGVGREEAWIAKDRNRKLEMHSRC